MVRPSTFPWGTQEVGREDRRDARYSGYILPIVLEGPVAQPKMKERVIDAVRGLPDDATVEDAMERLYFIAKVEEGARQADAGETVSHEEARRRIFE